jgi:uncharacterized protein (TIGR03083 family)
MSVQHEDGRSAVVEQLERFTAACEGLTDRDLLAPSRCWGWTVLDVVVHVRAGLQEMLGGVVSRSTQPPTADAAGYWAAAVPGTDAEADDIDALLWTRRTASAYRRPTTAVRQLRDVAGGLAAAVRDMPEGPVRFQGHVLASGDFLATWAVELAVHHLDVTVALDLPEPTATSLRLARRTVEALLGAPLPPTLADADSVLLATGRTPLTGPDAELLGALAARLPVLG